MHLAILTIYQHAHSMNTGHLGRCVSVCELHCVHHCVCFDELKPFSCTCLASILRSGQIQKP